MDISFRHYNLKTFSIPKQVLSFIYLTIQQATLQTNLAKSPTSSHTMTSVSSRNYSIVEPHPHATKPYIHTSRGGAGNVVKSASGSKWGSTSSTSSSASFASSSQPNTFKSGRGGAGNVHHNSERAIFSFDEELQREMRQQEAMAPVYHVGRGGVGNMAHPSDSSSRRKNSETASTRSTSSTESGADIATRAIRRSLGNGWHKVSERF